MPDTPATITSENDALSRTQVRRALGLWTWEACTATVHVTLTTGAFLTGFALLLGASSFVIGVLAAIPSFAGLIQLASSYFAQHYGNRKALTMGFSLASRLLWLPMVFIPLLPRPAWLPAFLLLLTLSSLCGSIYAPLWTAWISDLIPAGTRGRYFGQRNMYAGLVGMVVSIGGGAFLDFALRHHLLSRPVSFGLLFAIACLFALAAFAFGVQSPDVPRPARPAGESETPRQSAWAYYAVPFNDPVFRRVIVFYGAFVVAQNIAAQFFIVYQLKYLGLTYTAFQLLNAVGLLTSLAAMPLWGYLADKYGNKPILAICIGIVLLPPFLWLLAAPDNIPGLWAIRNGVLHLSYAKLDIIVLNTLAGLGWAGVGLTQFNLMIDLAPAERRTVYVSSIAAVSGVAGGLAPLAGGAIMEALAHTVFPAHGLVRTNYHVLFLLSGALRLVGWGLLRGVREQGSSSTRYVLDQITASPPIGSIAGIQKLSRGNSADARRLAAASLGRLRTPVAVEELVRALEDVALPVREQAAASLGEIGDPRALPSLLRKLSDPASGIESVAATALGKIGHGSAFASLAAAAQLGPLPRRFAAITALGRLDDPRVTEVLSLLTDDSSVRVFALRALSEREDTDAVPLLLTLLNDETNPASLAVLADALGRLAVTNAVAPLLSALTRTDSPTVHREILHALGSIYGGRDAFYPYLALEPHARDNTVSRILVGLQRRLKARARSRVPGAARLSIAAGNALAAHTSGNLTQCLRALTRLDKTARRYFPAPNPDPALVLRAFDEMPAAHIIAEDVLLCVFLLRSLAERL